MAKNIAVGILRPPHVFFYEVDVKVGEFRATQKCLRQDAKESFDAFSLYRTKHGYHIIGYPYRQEIFKLFQVCHPSDFTMKLKPRFGRKEPQILRISEKFDLKTGKVVSPAPKFICGNLFLDNIQKYKVMYYAK
jgi:hypothetical protein